MTIEYQHEVRPLHITDNKTFKIISSDPLVAQTLYLSQLRRESDEVKNTRIAFSCEPLTDNDLTQTDTREEVEINERIT